jgi:hygromycin-B 7''-O-kinase
VDPDIYELTGIVDWSNAAWADPAHDFSGFPLRMIPMIVEGARQAGDLRDKNVEGRILWQWVSLALWEMAKLDLSAEDRAWWRWPVGGLDEVATFLRESPDKAWRKWAPA